MVAGVLGLGRTQVAGVAVAAIVNPSKINRKKWRKYRQMSWGYLTTGKR
jgi:hypothetical protein